MEALTIDADDSITIRFTLADRRALERVLNGPDATAITLWRYLRTEETK
jgi:hypothetical protein